jgi:hypothetical protein
MFQNLLADRFKLATHRAATQRVQIAVSNATLKRFGFLMPSDLASHELAEFNRRMWKTARPVVWESAWT